MISAAYIRKPDDFVENEAQTDQILTLSNKEAAEFVRYQLGKTLSAGALFSRTYNRGIAYV